MRSSFECIFQLLCDEQKQSSHIVLAIDNVFMPTRVAGEVRRNTGCLFLVHRTHVGDGRERSPTGVLNTIKEFSFCALPTAPDSKMEEQTSLASTERVDASSEQLLLTSARVSPTNDSLQPTPLGSEGSVALEQSLPLANAEEGFSITCSPCDSSLQPLRPGGTSSPTGCVSPLKGSMPRPNIVRRAASLSSPVGSSMSASRYRNLPQYSRCRRKKSFSMSKSLPSITTAASMEYYLVWVPYAFLYAHLPHLLGYTMRCMLEKKMEEKERGVRRGSSKDGHQESPPEEFITMCVRITDIAKIKRRINEQGMYCINVCCKHEPEATTDGGPECNGPESISPMSEPLYTSLVTHSSTEGHRPPVFPFVFLDGGITRFLDAMKRVSPLRQSNLCSDVFLLYGSEESAAGSSETMSLNPSAPAESLPRQHHRRTNRAKSDSPGARSPQTYQVDGFALSHADMRKILYDNVGPDAKWKASLANVFGAVRSGFFGLPLTTHSPTNEYELPGTLGVENECSGSSPSSDGFELIERIVPVEKQRPVLPHGGKQLGEPLSKVVWMACFVGDDRVLDMKRFTKAIHTVYHGGLEDSIRFDVWCHLLHVFPTNATQAQREQIALANKKLYEQLTDQWSGMCAEQEAHFSAYQERKQAVEKDVVRTDRIHPAYSSEKSQQLVLLKNVLMAHVMLNFDLGYCQGMSDVASVVGLITDSEEAAFMCFRHLLRERMGDKFRGDVRYSITSQLHAISVLVRHFVPKLYVHLERHGASDMAFCFRWVLMTFKREFSVEDTMRLWDVILACPYTSYFEVFIAAALLKALSKQILDQQFTYDELVKFANSLAGNVPVQDVIMIAHDFYDQVCGEVVYLERSKGSQGENCRPDLDEVIHAIVAVDGPLNAAPSS